jgi:hypothetical protein
LILQERQNALSGTGRYDQVAAAPAAREQVLGTLHSRRREQPREQRQLGYAFITQGILGALPGEERAIGGAGIAAARLTGAAAGSAMAAAVANLAGFAHGFSAPAARAAGVWVFLAALPVAALACLSAWHMGRPRVVRAMRSS